MSCIRTGLCLSAWALFTFACGGEAISDPSGAGATGGVVSAKASGGKSGSGAVSGVGATTATTTNTKCDPATVAISSSLGTSSVACPAAVTCMESSCAAGLNSCYGSNYKTGNYTGGKCETYLKCISACKCLSSCTSKCQADSTCSSCLSSQVLVCAMGKCLTAALSCSTTGVGGAGG